MARVLGLGGIFFKSKDPVALKAWYAEWLGFEGGWDKGISFQPELMPTGGYSVWSAFPSSTTYFEPAAKDFMINLVIDDLDAMLARIKLSGVTVLEKIEESEYGRFGWFLDPDGNKVELWEPPER